MMENLNETAPLPSKKIDVEKMTAPDDKVDKSESVPAPRYSKLKINSTQKDLMEKKQKEMVKIAVPSHRYTPLKQNWQKIFTPLVEHMKLQVRMNTKTRNVELRSSEQTEDPGALGKGADFVKAFLLGFDLDDSIALLRLDELFIDTFEIEDVKNLKGNHLSRAIGRIAGKDGKTKFMIENVTRTRVVLADRKIHILGSYQNIAFAKDAICNLILGSPPGKVYGKLRKVSSLIKERL